MTHLFCETVLTRLRPVRLVSRFSIAGDFFVAIAIDLFWLTVVVSSLFEHILDSDYVGYFVKVDFDFHIDRLAGN